MSEQGLYHSIKSKNNISVSLEELQRKVNAITVHH